MVAIGLVSVMPQAWVIGRPIFVRHASDSDFGTAEPPQSSSRRSGRSPSESSGSTPIQIVGTPAVTVTWWSRRMPAMALGVMFGPGMTSDEPANTAAYGVPQALAWNIGTIGSRTSRSTSPATSAMSTAIECSTVERCE